jgi:long-subunit acyl-CoA synthetase (AMP-forming)
MWVLQVLITLASTCQQSLLLLLLLCAAEMNYDALNEAEPAGEVLLRGPQLFSGYYKQVRL